jgi:hypothetical protein
MLRLVKLITITYIRNTLRLTRIPGVSREKKERTQHTILSQSKKNETNIRSPILHIHLYPMGMQELNLIPFRIDHYRLLDKKHPV